MTKFIHLSDLHIHSTEKEDNVNCRKIVKFIKDRYSDYDEKEKPCILLAGDIVDDGDEAQYKNAVNILKPLVNSGFKVMACPGNHDYGPLGILYAPKSQQLFQTYILCELLEHPEAMRQGAKIEGLYPMVDYIGNALFIGIDSVVGNNDEPLRFARGEVGEPQRKRLADILKENANSEKKIVVYFHHHPFYRNFFKRIVLEMEDAKEVLRILAGRADFVCFGHKHVSECWTAEYGTEWILASGKTTERNARNKLQFREVEIDGEVSRVSMITFK